MAPKAKKLNQTIEIPKIDSLDQKRSLSPKYPKTPGVRTPADEAIDFFESGFKPGEGPIRVYELALDPDGGPNKDRQVRTLHLLHTCADALRLLEIALWWHFLTFTSYVSCLYGQHCRARLER
jgi:hypothetical protein